MYREMNIGTAKPSLHDRQTTSHFFIDNLSIEDEYSVGDFEREVCKSLDQIFTKNDKVVMTGGTGLYINAVLEGLDNFPEVKQESKEKFKNIYANDGIKTLQSMLYAKDPIYAGQVDIANPHRLIRALSVIDSSGKTFSSFLTKKKKSRPFIAIKIALQMDRQMLYARINQRVDDMLNAGLLYEAEKLYPLENTIVRNTVGYAELFRYFDGDITLDEAIDIIKQNTRRYAKRQMTWFRNQGDWKYFEADNIKGMVEYITDRDDFHI